MTVPRPTMDQLSKDFLDENEKIYNLLARLPDDDFKQKTLFKDWTINRAIGHLHVFNNAADLTVRDQDAFQQLFAGGFTTMEAFETEQLNGLHGQGLLSAWRKLYTDMAERFSKEDPKKRVMWFGPPMAVQSKLSARIMETWSHSQAIFDALGAVRPNSDAISSIAVMGVNTYKWTFQCRGDEPPEPMPYVKLDTPSGKTWTWGTPTDSSCVTGSAEEFCQVVSQCRNIKDTKLKVVGDVATKWMSIAQCFAGAPEEPPAPGTRYIQTRSKL